MGDNENSSKRHDNPRNQDHDIKVDNIRIVGDTTTVCGFGSCTPSWIQCLANPKLFTAHCTAIFALMICSFAYFGGILTTVERQFQLSSSESGTITIINDFVSLSFVLFASYFGHGAHRPRWIAVGTVLVGIGVFLFTMPHFTTDPLDLREVLYGNTKHDVGICILDATDSSTLSSAQLFQNESSNHLYNSTFSNGCGSTSTGFGQIWWIIIGQVIVGIGSAPLYPLVTTYIDDAVGKRRLVSYMGECSILILSISSWLKGPERLQ